MNAMEIIKNITQEYLEKLQTLERAEGDILRTSPPIIKLLEDMFGKLKAFISDYTFKDENEEILFFKEIKPWFGPLLIGLFYRRLNIHKSFALNLS